MGEEDCHSFETWSSTDSHSSCDRPIVSCFHGAQNFQNSKNFPKLPFYEAELSLDRRSLTPASHLCPSVILPGLDIALDSCVLAVSHGASEAGSVVLSVGNEVHSCL